MHRLLFKVYLAISILQFLLFGIDKLSAKQSWSRIPEKWLHGFNLLGAFPGALFGMYVWNHKHRKLAFKLSIWAAAIIHLTLWLLIKGRIKVFA